MTRWTRSFLAAATILVGLVAAFPRAAEARGHFGFRGGIIVGGFFGGPRMSLPYCGFNPYWGPCYDPYGPYRAFDMGMAAAAGIGAVDMNVKPGDAEVWVDGRFVAPAKDLDGSPGFLWLKEGSHRVVVYKGGYRSFDEPIAVQPGRKMDLKVRLDKGDSRPPERKAGLGV